MYQFHFTERMTNQIFILLFVVVTVQCTPPLQSSPNIVKRTANAQSSASDTIVDVKEAARDSLLNKNTFPSLAMDTIAAQDTTTEKTASKIVLMRPIQDTTLQNPQSKQLENKPPKQIDTLQTQTRTFLEKINRGLEQQGFFGGARTYKGVKYDVFILNLRDVNIAMHWKNSRGSPFTNLGNVKKAVEQQGDTLLFATNGGIYAKDNTPEGLFIEKGIEKKALNTKDDYGNFYMKPNGVFLIANNSARNNPIASIVQTKDYEQQKKLLASQGFEIIYAVQSGPMLGIDGNKHPKFNAASPSKRIRNGVGVLDNKRVAFAIPQTPVNLFDFYSFFNNELYCSNSLYLDGVISKMYISSPNAQRKDLNGNFVTIISVTK